MIPQRLTLLAASGSMIASCAPEPSPFFPDTQTVVYLTAAGVGGSDEPTRLVTRDGRELTPSPMTPRVCPFVLVIGWRTSLRDAVRRAQDFAGFLGVASPCVFAWHNSDAYLSTRNHVLPRVVPGLTRWLCSLDSPPTIFAHSMGADLTLRALEMASTDPACNHRIAGQVALFSADVSMNELPARLIPAAPLTDRITFLTSRCDTPLALSSRITETQRAGSTYPWLRWTHYFPHMPFVANVEAVDVSGYLNVSDGHDMIEVSLNPLLRAEWRAIAAGRASTERDLFPIASNIWRTAGLYVCSDRGGSSIATP